MGWFDYLMLVVLVYAFYEGFRKGFIRMISEVISLFLGYWAAGNFSDQFVDWVAQMGVSPQWAWWTTAILVFIVVVMVARMIGEGMSRLVRLVLLDGVNKLLGVAASLLKSALIISIIIQLSLLAHATNAACPVITSKQSLTYPWVKDLAPQVVPHFQKMKAHVR